LKTGYWGGGRKFVTGGCRKLLNEELHNLYASPNIIRMIKPQMRWMGMWHAWRNEKFIQNFNRKTLREETTSEAEA
jgi:hypothetical protein